MSVGGAGSASETSGPDGASGVGADDGSVSESEAASVAGDAAETSDVDAASVGDSIAADADSFEGSKVAEPSDDDAVEAADEAAEAELEAAEDEAAVEATIEAAEDDATAPVEDEAPVEEPSMLESVAGWAVETAKGYGTGAVNTVLDAANLVNSGVNLGLEAAGVDFRFDTNMGIAPTSEAERHAQNAVAVASVVTGVAGLAKSAPAIAKGIDAGVDLITGTRRGTTAAAPGTVATGTATTAVLGDLRPSEIARIQAAADQLGADLYVVGSAAKGARRNIDTDLPFANFGGAKTGTRSDIDYVVRTDLDDVANGLDLPDIDPNFGVRGVGWITLDNSPAIRFSPGRAPEVLEGTGRLTLD